MRSSRTRKASRASPIFALHRLRLAADADGHLVDDAAVFLVQLGVQDRAQVLQPQAGLEGLLADAAPDLVALAGVHEAHGVAQPAVDLAFEDALEVAVHLSPGHQHFDRQRHGAALRHGVDVRAGDLDAAVLDLAAVDHVDVLHGVGILEAELHLHVVLADALALEGRRVADGNVDLLDLHLHRRGCRCRSAPACS